MTPRPIAIDLFAGAGGLSLGVEKAGFDVIAAVESDPIHCATHEFNFPACKVICGDAAKMTGESIRHRSGAGRRTVDLVCGGSPCQGFSMMGKRALDDPRNALVLHFVRLVKELDASYLLFENVRGLTIGKQRSFLDELVEAFDQNGYAVAPWQVLNAADYGVPQSRERLFIYGAKKRLPLPEYPSPTHSRFSGSKIQPTPTVAEALFDLPDADTFEDLWTSDSVKAEFGPPSRYAAAMREISVRDESDLGYPRTYDHTILTSSLRADHTAESRRRFAATTEGMVEAVSRFYKLAANGISNTLRAGTGSERGAFTAPRPIHPTFARCVTVREMARLHSFPDWFRFHVTKWHGARQIGNSVPPRLARAVVSQIVSALGKRLRPPSTPMRLGDPMLLSLTMVEAAKRYGIPGPSLPKRIRDKQPLSASKTVP